MTRKSAVRPDLQVVPMLLHETLYVGIDIGKLAHVAGFVSTTLLARHQRFEACPALSFDNSREGFRALLDRIRTYVPLTQVYAVYVRYNQGIKQEMLPQPEPLRETEKTCLPHLGGTPHDRHTLGTVPAGGGTRSGPQMASEASSPAACARYD